MASFVTIYGSSEGQTAKVAAHIDEEPRANGHETTQ